MFSVTLRFILEMIEFTICARLVTAKVKTKITVVCNVPSHVKINGYKPSNKPVVIFLLLYDGYIVIGRVDHGKGVNYFRVKGQLEYC